MSEIIAKVNGINIHKSYLERILDNIKDNTDDKNLSDYTLDELKTQILEQLIDRALLVSYADEHNIEIGIEDLLYVKDEFELNDLDISIPIEEQISEEMSQDIKMEMIKRKIFDKMHEENDDYEYDEEKLKEFYSYNKNMFQVGEAVKVRHIFVATKDIKNHNDYSKSLNKIKKAEELLKSGINFEKVAKEYSECPSRDSGGDLGIVKKGQLGEDFDQYAFNITESKISEIFETEYGLHIIEVLEKYENYCKPYEKVKSRLIDNIKTERVVYFFEKLLEELRDNAQIEIYSI